jgi:hypothetical protein
VPEVELGGRARQGRVYGHMESLFGESHETTRWLATDVGCPECGTAPGTACPSPRIHQGRLDIALEMARAGELPPAPEPEPTEPRCTKCGTKRTMRGNYALACDDPEHQCERIDPASRRPCPRARVPGSRQCRQHQNRWTDGSVVSAPVTNAVTAG